MTDTLFFDNITQQLPRWVDKKAYSQIAVLVDEHTAVDCYPIISKLLPAHKVIHITSGEESKNLQTCTYIWQELTESQFDRKSLLINLGGGVIGDMGGFVAATYKRGIDFIQVPTTLLSQVDASIGGKLGIDFHGFKNHIGLFRDPQAVFIDSRFLNTLPTRELWSGFAEVIKHSLIADATLWNELLKTKPEQLNWKQIVPRAVSIKQKVVKADPQEKGVRKILNFGHTVGHALESYYLYTSQKLLHGEAIVLGMLTESFISWRLGLIKEEELVAIEDYLSKIYPQQMRFEIDAQTYADITQLMYQDKKNERGTIKMALLDAIGKAIFDQSVSASLIKESLLHQAQLQR